MRFKQVFTIALFLFLLLNIFSFNTLGNDISNKTSNSFLNSNGLFDGYIIEFVEDSLLKFKNTIKEKINDFIIKLSEHTKDSFLRSQIQNYKEKLISIQNQVKADILKLLFDRVC